MKTDREGLAGLAAQAFCYFQMKQHASYCNAVQVPFGSCIDMQLKVDMLFRSTNGLLYQCDIKGSINWPSCSISVPNGNGVDGHPFFKDSRGLFVFPFRDEQCIYVVNGRALWNLLLSTIDPNAGSSGKQYYIVSAQDIASTLPKTAYGKVQITGQYETFGKFFNACFKGNELEEMPSDQINSYVNGELNTICQEKLFGFKNKF